MDAVLFDPEISTRRALILALGTYGTEGLSAIERKPLIGTLLELYRNDADAGIHGAVEWTLHQWNQRKRLEERDAELMSLKDRGDRRWFVNGQGQTFAVIEGPVELRMGSPSSEPERQTNEILHRSLIPYRFALAVKEVTVEQYFRFEKETPWDNHAVHDRYCPDPKGPMNLVCWYHAAAYCNWLGRKEGLPECYEPNSQGKYASGMTIKANALRSGGYRLPTEMEWEYACRAGAETSRPYGASPDLLGRYAWYITTSQDRAWLCGSLQPNDLGLFDMLGNVFEWCQDPYLPYNIRDSFLIASHTSARERVDQKPARVLRGGSFPDRPQYLRSAARLDKQPSDEVTNAGFRPSRSCP